MKKETNLARQILQNNKMLYCMHKRPMTETCMCWGLEVPDVWLDSIDELSKKLEAMNIVMYPKHRTRIQAAQVKDKFGTLRFYFDIVIDPPKWVCQYESTIQWMFDMINKLDFRMKRVVDKEAYEECREEPLEDGISFEDAVEKYKMASNVKIIKDSNGKIIKLTTLQHCQKIHYEPTRFKLLHRLWLKRYSIKNFIRSFIRWEPSHSQICIHEFLKDYATKEIAKTEEELMDVCEKCGRHIGSDYSPRCVTHGWISYLCEDCAKESNSTYTMNGNIWKDGKEVESSEPKKIDEDYEVEDNG